MINVDTIDNFPISFYIIDKDIIVDCNIAAVNMFGYENKQDIIGLKPFDLSPLLQDDGIRSDIKGREIIKKAFVEKNVNFKWLHLKKNGDTFLAFINLIYVNNVLFAFLTNISEFKRLEDTIKEKDYIYKLLFEENNNVMYLIDPNTCNIIDANKAAVNYYGYDLKTLKTMKINDLTINNDNDVKEYIKNILSYKQNFFLLKHINKNNEIRDVEISSFPITLNNQQFLFNIIYDVTERVRQNVIINTFLTQSPYPIAILDNEQQVININEKFTSLFQYEKDEVIGKNLNDLITSMEFRDELNNNIEKVFKENFIRVKTLRKRKDNKLIDVEIVAFPITYNDKIIGAYVHYIDITQKIKDKSQLEVFKKVLENSNEGIVITDSFGHTEWINHAFTQITGYTLNDIFGSNPRILKSNLQNQEFYNNMWYHIIHDHHWHGEIWNKNKKGEIYPEWLSIYAITNKQITTHYVGIFKDLSEMKTIDQKMRVLAQKDALTGLCNRVYFTERLNQILKTEQTNDTAILFIDLDHFKEINDSLGHHIGDQFLIELSNRFQKIITGNNLIARFGGDEFVILLRGFNSKIHVMNMAKKVFSTINEPYIYQENYLQVSGSIGISIYPKDGQTSDELIQNADIAMYAAKKNFDKKLVYYTPKMRKDIDERFKIANLLREAIEEKSYTILYEPIYDLNTNKILSVEAKIKWKQQQLNLSTKKYFKIALENGLINKIFNFTFEEVCIQLTKHKNFTTPISINISIEQLEQNQFIFLIKEILKKYPINPKYIEFEFTDNNVVHSNRITKNIHDLLKLGFNFTLDNFSEENFSIALLKHYSIKKIKLDKNLLRNLTIDSMHYEFIKMFRLNSKIMNIALIAKGISQIDQLTILKNLKLDGGQGSYFSKPIRFSQINKLIQTKSDLT